MTWMITGLRRTLWLVLVGATGGAIWAWMRDRTTPPGPPTPPEWPPLDTASTTPSTATTGTTASSAAPTAPTDAPATPEQATGAATARAHSGAPTAGAASVVNALVDAPDARSVAGTGTWVEPNDDGSCPLTHPIKANDNSGIYHVPEGRFYERTNAERCYASAEAAAADGYRAAKA